MGYGGARIILKCDQENPIAAVQQEVIKNRPDVATIPDTAQPESHNQTDVLRTQSGELMNKYVRFTISSRHVLECHWGQIIQFSNGCRVGSNDVDKIRDQK